MLKTIDRSAELVNDAADISQEEYQNEEVEHEAVPVLLASHLYDLSASAVCRCISLVDILTGLVDETTLIFKLSVCIDHDFVRLNCSALDTTDLISCLV